MKLECRNCHHWRAAADGSLPSDDQVEALCTLYPPCWFDMGGSTSATRYPTTKSTWMCGQFTPRMAATGEEKAEIVELGYAAASAPEPSDQADPPKTVKPHGTKVTKHHKPKK